MISNIWNNIIDWFSDRTEREALIRSFNVAARESFMQGMAPTVLKAGLSKGSREYKHQFSAWMNTGFRIQVLSGRSLSKDEMVFIGQSILNDALLVRRLVALGWDTLEIHDDSGIYGCRWKLIDYANIGRLLV